MTNYVDFDYWVQGYGEDDLSSPDLYVVAGYWDSGYCENEGISASVTTTSQGATSANVKYIGNFTNAGIFDSAAKNDLETVGNAQVSTTQAKWGTTSMAFDGTGGLNT